MAENNAQGDLPKPRRTQRSFILRLWRHYDDDRDTKDGWFGEIEPVPKSDELNAFHGLDQISGMVRKLLNRTPPNDGKTDM